MTVLPWVANLVVGDRVLIRRGLGEFDVHLHTVTRRTPARVWVDGRPFQLSGRAYGRSAAWYCPRLEQLTPESLDRWTAILDARRAFAELPDWLRHNPAGAVLGPRPDPETTPEQTRAVATLLRQVPDLLRVTQ